MGKKNFYFPHLASEQQQLQQGCPVSSQAPCHLISCLTPPRHSTAQTLVLFPPWVCNWCVHARACAYLRVRVRTCACAYWKCCGQKRFPSLCVWWTQDRKTQRAWQQEKTQAGRQTPRCGQTQVVIIITRKKQPQWLHSAKQAPWLKQLVPALRQPQVGVVLTLLNTLMASFFVLMKTQLWVQSGIHVNETQWYICCFICLSFTYICI